jgi:hypothetical protein
MRLTKLVISITAAVAVAGAYASGWTVTVLTSVGVLNPGSAISTVPTTIISNPLPQVTFNTAAGDAGPDSGR